MNEPDDRYLWDESGPADPEVERLERLLSRYRYDPARDVRPSELPAPARRRAWPRARGWLAIAAGLALLAFGLWWRVRPGRLGYQVDGLAELERAHAGESIATGAREHAVVRIAALGEVEVRPDSRLRVDDAGERHHKLFLERGEVRATILAQPGVFQIGTPAGLSVDLGCQYELRVDEDGTAHMAVLSGRVAFEDGERRVVVPRGAGCEATKERGPSVPIRSDAPRELREAIVRLENEPEPAQADLDTLLASEWDEHGVSLWYLFRYARSQRVREATFAALQRAHPIPEGADAGSILGGDEAQTEAWRQVVARRWGY